VSIKSRVTLPSILQACGKIILISQETPKPDRVVFVQKTFEESSPPQVMKIVQQDPKDLKSGDHITTPLLKPYF
jgi:hypothetical protein